MGTHIISEWFTKYSDNVYQYLIYRVGYKDAEDLAQEVFIRALKGIDSFQGNSQPKTWLIRIAQNVAVDYFRQQKRKHWKSYLSLDKVSEPCTDETPDFLLGMKEDNLILYKAIQSLKPSYKDVLILRGIQELSSKETAECLNWNENKVRITYFRAKTALKKKLDGGTLHEQEQF
ncbi:RNA polymerase sigma factor [Evansella clarkii]|uniref:RNA polymerase sigma factor n=1 Tax=Evansella clarkii TaxID=79879 RepID=UPI000997FEBF|nr:RNA polymerase sigma factor [Evansella clarkii]